MSIFFSFQISVFSLHNAFEKNQNIQSIFFAKNPWLCNCKFTPKFQRLMAKYEFIRDARNITCRHEEHNLLSGIKVQLLTKHDLCQAHDDQQILIIDIVNCILAVLIIIILSKLTYDYIQYRHYGRVPWIVTKMP